MVGPETFVLPLQNGLEAPTQLAAVLGNQHVLGGLCGLSTFMVLGTLLLVPVVFVENPSSALARMNPDTVMLVLFLGIFGGAIGYFLWTFALTHLSPTQVAVYINLNPMIATLLGATLLAEKLTGIFIASFAAVLAGVLLVNLSGRVQLGRRSIAN